MSATSSSMADSTLVEFRQIEPILRSVEIGEDVLARILRQIGLPGDMDDISPETTLRIADYFRLQRDIARALDDLTVQMSTRKLTYETGRFIISQIETSETLQDAVRGLADYFNMLHGDTYNLVRVTANTLTLVIDDTTFPYTFSGDVPVVHFVGDCLAIKLHCLLDSLSHGLAEHALRRIGLKRRRSDEGDRQNGFWSVPIKYGRPTYELVYDFDLACEQVDLHTDLDLSMTGIFARVISYLDTHRGVTDQRSFKERTLDLVANGARHQGDVARQLGISVATLRRRLDAENTGFRSLTHQARLHQAEALLAKGQSVTRVSEKLDYSDVRAFNRAFKKWKGQTPAAFARAWQLENH